MRDQFVISIGRRVHIPLTTESTRAPAGLLASLQPRKSRFGPPVPSPRRPGEIFPQGKVSAVMSVQGDLRHVVIHLRGLTGAPSTAAPSEDRIGFTVWRSRPTPPGSEPSRCPSLSPPARGTSHPCSKARGLLPVSRSLWGDAPPHPPNVAFGHGGVTAGRAFRPCSQPCGLLPPLCFTGDDPPPPDVAFGHGGVTAGRAFRAFRPCSQPCGLLPPLCSLWGSRPRTARVAFGHGVLAEVFFPGRV